MNVLFIATRAPYGRMHGHKMGIRTYLNAMKGAGHNVVLAAFNIPNDPPVPEDLGVTSFYLPLPSKWQVFRNLITRALPGSLSINECLYLNTEISSRVEKIVRQFDIEFVVADMARTAPYAERTGLPWIIDHEDLLSERYEMWAKRSSGDENILGYLENTVPRFLRPAAKWLFRTLLHRESKILAGRELYWTDRALASSLRSLDETKRLQLRTKRRVFCMPVSVPVPEKPVNSLDHRPPLAIFTGGLTYQPNLDALRAYVEQIIPEFVRRSIDPPTLHVIGAAPDNLRKPLEHPSIKFLGYVDDLDASLGEAQVFFAPIVSGTGIKTKVLEALAHGLPLIALPAGLTGLQGQHGKEYLRAKDAADFVDQFLLVRDNLALARSLAASGRQLAISDYSIEAATQIIDREIALALNPSAGWGSRANDRSPADALATASQVSASIGTKR